MRTGCWRSGVSTAFICIFLFACQPAVDVQNSPTRLSAATIEAATPSSSLIQTPSAAEKSLEATPISQKECEDITDIGIPNASSAINKSHILYQALNVQSNHAELWAVSLKNGVRKQLYKPGVSNFGIGFLRDAFHFVVIGYAGQVVISDINDSEAKIVTTDHELLDNFRPYSVFWQRLQEGNPNFVDPGIGSYMRGENYSPDGKKIVSYQLGDPALVIVDVETKTEVPIVQAHTSPTGGGDMFVGQWSEDGKLYIFTRYWKENDILYSQLYSVDRNGDNLQALIEPLGGIITSVRISPDRDKVVFALTSWDTTNRTIIGVLIRSTGQVRMFETDAPIVSQAVYGIFVWSPDSKFVAYLTEWMQRDIRVANIDNGKIYCITNDRLREEWMDWK